MKRSMEKVTVACKEWCEARGGGLKALALLLFAAIIIVALCRDRIVNSAQWQVSVSGQGKVAYQPDIALVDLGVIIEDGATAEEVIGKMNNLILNAVASLETLGIPREDIQTGAYSVYPAYDDYYSDQICNEFGCSSPIKNERPSISGYSGNQTITITVRDIQNKPTLTGAVVGIASKNGINQVNSIRFEASNQNELKQEARLLAIVEAKKNAKVTADAAGVRLGEVVGWWENPVWGPGPMPYYDSYGGRGMEMAAQGAAPYAGTNELVMEVTLNYRVK